MQVQMSFLETPAPAGSVPVWTVLDDEQREMVLAALARLIAKVTAVQDEKMATDAKESIDE